MANVKITDLPQINFSSITNNDVIPIVDVNSNTTSKVLISDLKTFFSTPFTGGTVSGNTIFQNGLTANTISATTYQNLPKDIFVTGGSFSNGVITFTNNIGGTFSVSGISSFDTFVTGGTYSNGVTTFTNNSGNTFSVAGYFTGYTNVVNTLTTGIGLSANTTSGNITIINTSPDQIVTISGGTGITTGGTYPNFTITNSTPDQTVILNDGNNISVVGTYPNFTINVTGLTDNDRYVTGFSYNNNTFTIGDNSGNTYDATFNDVTGLTVNGTLSATTISGGTLYGDGSNIDNIVASGITYDNISSGLSATTVQEAIDELNDGNFQYQNGGVYNTFMVTSDYFGSSSVPFTPGLLLAYPIYVQQDVTIDAIRIGITSFAVGSLVIGLYDCVNGLPNSLLFQTTAFNTGINGYQIITVGNQTIKKGVYYVTYNSNSTPSMLCINSSSLPNVIGWKNSSGDGAGVIIGRNYAYIGTLPSTWGSVTSIYPASVVTVVPSFEFRII